jgi:hypothetical protein
MRILFCNIAQMKYYKGIIPGKDEPQYGGDFVLQTGDAHEKYNFEAVTLDGDEVCLGFFETKSTNGSARNQLHIEKIEGARKADNQAEDVLVIWCAKRYDASSVVVGWYKHATVYRDYQECTFDSGYQQFFNVLAKTEDCVLLPTSERTHQWWAPRRRQTRSFGFGQANVWFAEEESAKPYIEKLVKLIDGYHGENWLYKDVDKE